jgi:hypothetical protein
MDVSLAWPVNRLIKAPSCLDSLSFEPAGVVALFARVFVAAFFAKSTYIKTKHTPK